MRSTHPLRAAALAVAAATVSLAQTEYELTILPSPANAISTIPAAINNAGTIVGWSQFSDGSTRSWRWTQTDGLVMLPAPAGDMADHYQARDINENGVIAGDGGFDFGNVWRLEDGAYLILGAVDSLPSSRDASLNDAGSVAGTAFNPGSFLTPTRGFTYSDADGLQPLSTSGSTVDDLNDAGQLTGHFPGPGRMEPDGSVTSFPVPSGYFNLNPEAINENGDVAGLAICTHECSNPFFYGDDTGVVIVPGLGTRHRVNDMNIHRQMVGGIEEGIARGWRWTPGDGIQALHDLIDPALNVSIFHAYAINDGGVIVATGQDFDSSPDRQLMLLTPINPPGIVGDLDNDGDVDNVDLGQLLAAYLACQGDTNFNPAADLNDDGCVNNIDLGELLANYLTGV